MKKHKLALFFGGFSSEYHVSLASAYAVLRSLDREKYEPVPVGISREGKWYAYTGDYEKIKEDRWRNSQDCVPAVLAPDRGAHRLLLIHPDRLEEVHIDAAFPVMHGKYGEDGTLQGLIELSGIPLIGCGSLSSALCMDKHRAHQLAQWAGAAVPKSMVLRRPWDPAALLAFSDSTGFPLFVKPVKSGSSYGVTKVLSRDKLMAAVELAFTYDSEVMAEECIPGFEVGCAVMGGGSRLTVSEVDEIELSGGFFDYTQKYTLCSSSIHVPARIPGDTAARIKETAKTLYQALGCSGFARVDMFLTPEGAVYFNEINTIPGFTPHSRYPRMMEASGIPFRELLDRIIEGAVAQ